jgi:hypothetical protein
LDSDPGFRRRGLLFLRAPLRHTAELIKAFKDSNGARNRTADMQCARKLVKN